MSSTNSNTLRVIYRFFLLLMLFICGMHTVAFGHERYHLPLIPFLCLYAVAVVVNRSWSRLQDGMPVAVPPGMAWMVLLFIWAWEVFIVEMTWIQALLRVLFI